MAATVPVRRYQQRVSGSGITGDEFQYIETVPATDYDAVVAERDALRLTCLTVAGVAGYSGGPNDTFHADVCNAVRALTTERDALRPYLQHKPGCGYSDDGEYTHRCTCGLDAAMKPSLQDTKERG